MSTLFPHTIELRTSTGGAYVKGLWVPGTPVISSFVGSVQPATGKDVQDIQVGRDDTGKVDVYSNTPLIIATPGGDNKGDEVVWMDQVWELLHETKCGNGLINHFKYIGEYRGPAT